MGGAVALSRGRRAPLPAGLTPHSLRRTFASVLYAIGEPPPVVMAEMGHTHEGLALRIYAQAMRRDEAATERLRRLVGVGQPHGVADAADGVALGPAEPVAVRD